MDDDELAALLTGARTIAVVGASTSPGKPSHRIPALLLEAGYRVIPIHPTAEEVVGQRAYPSLSAAPIAIDIVDVFRPSTEAPGIARQAAEAGARALWLQLGLSSPEAERIAAEAELVYVEDRCIAETVHRLGVRSGH